MMDNRNRYMSMYGRKSDNAAQEIIIAIATAIAAIFLAGTIISNFGGQGSSSPQNNYPDSQVVVSDREDEDNSYDDADEDNGYDDEDTDDGYGDENEEDDYDDEDTEDGSGDNRESALPYTDNESVDIGACLSPSDYYEVTSTDGSFSFAYPKYLFNYSNIKEDDGSVYYNFGYNNGIDDEDEISMSVYSADNDGDALENVKDLYEFYSGGNLETYFTKEPERVDGSGMARALMGVKNINNVENQCGYIILVNDGEKDYIMEFYYQDDDPDYEYDDIDYVVDCIYRYCSFSGSTYEPRTLDLFLNDDMGTKK